MFNDMLRTQLILKNIVTPEDWEIMEDHIQYDFIYDNQFAELKESELMEGRLNILQVIEPYVGKYYSQDYIRRRVLRQTDGEIVEIDEQIEQEIQDGIIPDPSVPIDPETGQPMEGDPMGMGEIPVEPDLASAAASVDAQLQKDTKKAEI